MATVLRIRGYQFIIFTKESKNERPHVHIFKGDARAKVWLDSLSFAKSRGYNGREETLILTLVMENRVLLQKAWDEKHGA